MVRVEVRGLRAWPGTGAQWVGPACFDVSRSVQLPRLAQFWSREMANLRQLRGSARSVNAPAGRAAVDACGERKPRVRRSGTVLRVSALRQGPDPDPGLDLSEPFTCAQLVAAGYSRRMVRQKRFAEIVPGVHVLSSAIGPTTLIKAALLIHPADACASHGSAAVLLGLPVPDPGFAHVTVFRQKDRRYRREIKSHVTTRRRRIVLAQGVRVTDPITTFIACAGQLGLVDLVVLGDALVRRCRTSPAQLVRACQVSTDYYRKRALAAALFVREGVDSPMETRLRMLIVLAGLPEPVVNHRTFWEDGSLRRRFDLYYPGIRLIVEYDGRQHASDTRQWQGDLDRREELDDEGYRILVVTAEGVFRSPGRTLERVRRQLVERGMDGVPAIDATWREHFPS
ncbi:DUF559 domain-containing protein [Nocardioides sp. 1609]|uniref:endonuclease domain-containing protein n=1 Tax=Nocardioides sp. 1609 TaxID=2508327 RepID=UPI001ADAC304|nr:DUF559 domain-containing protein [Nocardioides sp. 1609]